MTIPEHQWINPAQLANELEISIESNVVALLFGGPGVAKSAVGRQTADKLEMGYCDFRAATKDPTEIFGYSAPEIATRRLVHCLPEFLPTENDKPTLINIEEVNTASHSVMNTLLGFTNERQVGEFHLADHHRIILTGNPPDMGGMVQDMSDAFTSRFTTYYVKPDLKQWKLDFAFGANIHADVLAHLELFPDQFWVPDYDGESNTTHANPRTWELASKHCHGIERRGNGDGAELARWVGTVGPVNGESFAATRACRADLVSPLEALLNPDTARTPESSAGCYLIASAMASIMTDDNVGGIIRYMDRTGPEYAMFTMRDGARRNPTIVENVEYLKWATEHAEMFNNAF